MGKSSKNSRRQPSAAKKAFSEGIVPIKRKVSPESHEVLVQARRGLRPEIGHAGNYIRSSDVGLTLIEHSQLKGERSVKPPKSEVVIDAVESCRRGVSATIGGIDFYGSKLSQRHECKVVKIGFKLESPEITEEFAELIRAYEKLGYKVPPRSWQVEAGDEESNYAPHLTIGQFPEYLLGDQDDDALKNHFGRAAGVIGSQVMLQAVPPPPQLKR